MLRFKQDVIEKMQTDPDLFAAIAKETGLKPASLTTTIERNGNRINQFGVVKIVSDYLGTRPEDLLEDSAPAKEVSIKI